MAISITSTTQNYESMGDSVLLIIVNDAALVDTATIIFTSPNRRVEARYTLSAYGSMRVNVIDYALSVLDIEPTLTNIDWLETGRIVTISEAASRFELLLRGGEINPTSIPALLSDLGIRRIAPNQMDEISLLTADGAHTSRVVAGSADFVFNGVQYKIAPFGNGVRLCWVNRYGAIDYYNFSATTLKESSVEKSRSKLNNGWYAEVTKITKQFTVEADAIADDDTRVIGYILESPSAWLVNDDNSFTPIDIVTTSAKEYSYDKISRLTIKYQLRNED